MVQGNEYYALRQLLADTISKVNRYLATHHDKWLISDELGTLLEVEADTIVECQRCAL